MVFIGYESGSKAYRMYNPEDRKLVVARDVVFEEGRPWDWSSACSVKDVNQEPLIVLYPNRQEPEEVPDTAEKLAETPVMAGKAADSAAAGAPRKG
jgi:hypothetical protein